MAIMDELTEQEVSKNKAIRGYIIRALAKGNQNTLLVRQITNALVADGLIFSPDISKHLEYLEEAGYIVFTNRAANAYNAYSRLPPGRRGLKFITAGFQHLLTVPKNYFWHKKTPGISPRRSVPIFIPPLIFVLTSVIIRFVIC